MAEFHPNPHRLYRTHRLAELLDVHPSTVWRWRQIGILPAPVEIGGVRGWTEAQVTEVFDKRPKKKRHAA